ncbi:MAG TPA: immunoglobulin domain-containing protein, partial [Opitutaceae bacterium]
TTATPSGQTVILTYTGTGSTTYGPSTTAPTDAGTYSVTATFDVGSNYAATATVSFTISTAAQTITFAPLSDRLISSGPLVLAATSSSGLPVSFTVVSGSPSIATLAGNTLTPTGVQGSVTLRATQAGNANYLAAAAVERTLRFVNQSSAPVLLASPSDTTGHIGGTVTLSAAVGGVPTPTVQWRKNGVDIPGATDTQLTFTSAALSDTGSYQIVATNLSGSVTSIPITLTITKRPQSIAFPPPAAAYPAGSSVTLQATASSGLSVAYALVSGPGTLTGNTLTAQSGDIVIRATQAGDGQYNAAEPVERTFRFVAGAISAFIIVPPADQSALAGTDVVFRASAVGTPTPTLRWQKDGNDISGATAATLTLPRVTLADAGRYTVIATNLGGSSQASAQLTVRAAPQIVTQPASRTATLGAAATFQVTAIGVPAPTYQWRRNGAAIGGATGTTLTFPRINTGDAGRYDVVVTNAIGSVTSEAATLTVEANALAGAYFGRFTAGTEGAGNLAVLVRPDGTAVL